MCLYKLFFRPVGRVQRAIRSVVAVHRTAHRADHAHGATRVGQQVSEPYAHAARLLHRHAAARLQRASSVPYQVEVSVRVPVRGDIHGRVHAQNLQFHQRPRNTAFDRQVRRHL